MAEMSLDLFRYLHCIPIHLPSPIRWVIGWVSDQGEGPSHETEAVVNEGKSVREINLAWMSGGQAYVQKLNTPPSAIPSPRPTR